MRLALECKILTGFFTPRHHHLPFLISCLRRSLFIGFSMKKGKFCPALQMLSYISLFQFTAVYSTNNIIFPFPLISVCITKKKKKIIALPKKGLKDLLRVHTYPLPEFSFVRTKHLNMCIRLFFQDRCGNKALPK